MAGPWICILGGVYTDKIVVQPLTEFISLMATPRDDGQLHRIARLFEALRLAFNRLDLYYRGLNIAPQPDFQRFFPSISFYTDANNVRRAFTYLAPLLDDRKRPLWIAKGHDNKEIVVKFTRKYNAGAHDICARAGFAPPILSTPVAYGDYLMIVMPFVSKSCALSTISVADMKSMRKTSRERIYKNVADAINLLHGQNIVFGDLRPPNILIFDNAENQKQAMLIDFEWCGVANVGRYPLSMCPDIPWSHTATPNSFLLTQHDIDWLEKLRERLLLV